MWRATKGGIVKTTEKLDTSLVYENNKQPIWSKRGISFDISRTFKITNWITYNFRVREGIFAYAILSKNLHEPLSCVLKYSLRLQLILRGQRKYDFKWNTSKIRKTEVKCYISMINIIIEYMWFWIKYTNSIKFPRLFRKYQCILS